MSAENLARAVELSNLARENPEVRMAISAVLERTQCASLGHFAEEHPDAFLELHEAMVDMVEQLPTSSMPRMW